MSPKKNGSKKILKLAEELAVAMVSHGAYQSLEAEEVVQYAVLLATALHGEDFEPT